MWRLLLLCILVLACKDAPQPGAPDAAAPAPPAAASLRDAGAPAPAPVEPPRESAQRVPLAGKVLDLGGMPVEAAVVRVGSVRESVLEDGSFLMKAPLGAGDPEVSAPGFRTERVPFPRDGHVTVRLVAVGTVGGAVQGAPHARVRIAGSGIWPPRETTADALGRYAFADVPEGVYELSAVAEGLATRLRAGVSVEGPGGAATVDLEARPAARVVGRVLAAGEPVSGVRVTLTERRMALLGHDALSQENGAFSLAGLAPGPYSVRIEAPGFAAPPPAEVEVAAPTTVLPLSVQRGGRIAGRVLTHEGRPASGARLELRIAGSDGPAKLSTELARSRTAVARARGEALRLPSRRSRPTAFVADADGRFLLEGVPSGQVSVVASRAGSAPAASPAIEPVPGETAVVEVRLATPCAFSGRVVDDVGNSLDGARVVLVDPRALLERRVMSAGEGGRFRMDGLPPGRYRVFAVTPGLLPASRTVALRPDREPEIEIALVRGGVSVEGLVLDPNGNPVPGAHVSLRAGSGEPKSTVTDEVGHFRFEDLPEGRYSLRAEHGRYPPATLEGADGTEGVEIRFGAGGEIAGEVLDAEGARLAGALVVAAGDGTAGARAVTGDDGEFTLSALPAGRYTLLVTADGHAPSRRHGLVVEAGDRSEVRVALRRASDAGGSAAAGGNDTGE